LPAIFVAGGKMPTVSRGEIGQAFLLQRMSSLVLSFLPANLYGGSKRKNRNNACGARKTTMPVGTRYWLFHQRRASSRVPLPIYILPKSKKQ
jgi:hypothetical protein